MSLDELMSAPYTYRIFYSRPENEPGAWIAEVVELPACVSFGATPEEAFAMVREAMRGLIGSRLERGVAVPLPASLSRTA